jgi:outer membrane protein OmpA-like peptidoglycan-associated protein
VANEPGSTHSSEPIGMDADGVYNSTAEEASEKELEVGPGLAPEQPPEQSPEQLPAMPSASPWDSSTQPRPTLSANSPHFFSAQAALSRSMSALEAIDRAEGESFLEQARNPSRVFPTQPYASQPHDQPYGGQSYRAQPPVYSVGPAVGAAYELNAVALEGAPPLPRAKAWWEKPPYSAIAHLLALSGTLVGAWLFGILVAQILPGDFANPPLQEAMLRRSSRLSQRLWHFSQLWQTPTSETRIEAIPLPETGPLLAPINLPPIERQPLIDELNSVETELLTLDRRLQTIEKKLGKPPYQGASVENRVNSLRAAISPPVKSDAVESDYKPTLRDPNEQLLEVAQLKITLPSDALFSPGASELKDTTLLNQLLDQLVNYPKATVVIRSYSDNQAAATVSRDYTQQQAIALSEYLDKHLDSNHLDEQSDDSREGAYRWVTVGGGQSQPVASNDDDAGRQRNRRIEILVDTRTSR